MILVRPRVDRRYESTLRALRKRWALIVALGRKCVRCGTEQNLQIDHVQGRTWDIRAKSSSARVSLYWREFKAGVSLQVLCLRCNPSEKPSQQVIPDSVLYEEGIA